MRLVDCEIDGLYFITGTGNSFMQTRKSAYEKIFIPCMLFLKCGGTGPSTRPNPRFIDLFQFIQQGTYRP